MRRRKQVFYWILGNAIMRARIAAGLTQAKLAARVGLSRASITNIEVGRQVVQAHTLATLAEALSVEAATILPRLP